MQELNELKNLVIQALESNGALSNIRAQIRASVFKVIDTQETSQKKPSNYDWENNKCQNLHEEEEGKLLLQLIKEFLQTQKMDYSLSVFASESNMREDINVEQLAANLDVKPEKNKSVLQTLLFDKQQIKSDKQQLKQYDDPKKSLQEAQELIKKNQQFLKTGKLGEVNVKEAKKPALQQNFMQEQKMTKSDKYENDFEDDQGVEEDIDQMGESDMQGSKMKESNKRFQSSGEEILGASQSQGLDMSVDSLALEDYDYYEDADDV